jgi:hypothetical protein
MYTSLLRGSIVNIDWLAEYHVDMHYTQRSGHIMIIST